MTKLSPTMLYWLGWAVLTVSAFMFAWFLGPHIIARGIELWAGKMR